ncbi:MAG: acyl-CoA dehydrogenase family protein [Chloroflexi bacterium]|nr:acyl-CoA dehydrogenase family protein [Chloroflexota bacterium]
MDFSLTDKELMFQGQAREFARKRVRPQAMEIDRSNEFPSELAGEMARMGFRGLPFPARYGGVGAGYLSYALALEQVCAASMTVGAVMAVNTVPEEAIYRFGNEEQKQRLLSPLAMGEKLGGISFTEAETGSDPGEIQTASRLEGPDYVLSGEKQFVAMAPAVDLSLVFARNEGKGLNALVVETASPGYQVKEKYDTLGLRGLATCSVTLDNVRAPAVNLIGEAGKGFEVLLDAITLGRLGVAVEGVGLAQEALDVSLDYAKRRKALGKSLGRLMTIQGLLGEMASRLEAARWVTYRAAFLRDQGRDIKHESSLAKLFSSQMSVEVTRMAMQVFGSFGTVKNLPVERLYRDAKMAEIYVGIAEIQRSIIAARLLSSK